MESNQIIANLPKHLKSFIVDQNYDRYTPADHALWRYVMRQNVNYLEKVAHQSYIQGLRKTGISIEQIPSIECMNDILSKIGWATVTVDGFIPPSAFMEFQANNVLVIAADIRPMNQIAYTPAPDIIHEAAGHAPIIAEPEYADYLRLFGEIGSKAFQSAQDYNLYEAIRHLSILKADPNTSEAEIDLAMQELNKINQNMGPASEMARIRNLHWWTVEYGLIGDINNPKIYGAGLLSSIGESYKCLQPEVKKIPFSIAAADMPFDITEQQPQLFVTPDFEELNIVLNEFADGMALRQGGLYALQKAVESKNTATIVYSSGLQVSGTVESYIERNNKAIYFKTTGPSNLNYKNKELEGHSKNYHTHGFSSPIGNLKGLNIPIENIGIEHLHDAHLIQDKVCDLEFESGLKVHGVLRNIWFEEGKLVLLSFSDCMVTFEEQVLFEPEWGMYDMAVGESIVSGYSGPADPEAFGLNHPVPAEKTHHIEYTNKDKDLHRIYQRVRDIREATCSFAELPVLWNELKEKHHEDWLCALEILELLNQKGIEDDVFREILSKLDKMKKTDPELEKLINDGLKLLT